MDAPWRPAEPLPPETFAAIRRQTIFEFCKWDRQVEDAPTLAEYPIVLAEEAWQYLCQTAEALYNETLAVERALLAAPRWHGRLALPRAVCRALAAANRYGVARTLARVMRFDFHFTTQGWRVSEVNSDVPGGFIEGSGFTGLMAEQYPEFTLSGDPAGALVDAVCAAAPGDDAVVGLVHATAYTDDRQVMQYLLQRLAERGVESRLISPADLQWRDGVAAVADEARLVNVSALIRFFPGEWLPNLPRSCCWSNFFSGGRTPQCNPATALLTQSKRWPLVADDLGLALPTWLSTTPETRAPAEVPWRTSDEWVLKPALGRVGESIGLPGITPPKEWQQIARHVRWHGRHWIAQRRFEPVPMPVAGGDMYPCIGVFVIDGKASGAYGRVSRRPLIDEKAQDAAVLVEGSPVVAAGARQACYDTNRAL